MALILLVCVMRLLRDRQFGDLFVSGGDALATERYDSSHLFSGGFSCFPQMTTAQVRCRGCFFDVVSKRNYKGAGYAFPNSDSEHSVALVFSLAFFLNFTSG